MKVYFSVESSSWLELSTTLLKVVDNSNVKKALNSAFEKCANLYLEKLLFNIETNKYGFKLTFDTVKKKLAKGKSLKEANTPFLFEREYIENIVAEQSSPQKWGVGCRDGMHYSGLSYNELSYILEFGRKDLKIPARPVWRLTYKECLTTFQEVVNKELSPVVVSELKLKVLSKFLNLKNF